MVENDPSSPSLYKYNQCVRIVVHRYTVWHCGRPVYNNSTEDELILATPNSLCNVHVLLDHQMFFQKKEETMRWPAAGILFNRILKKAGCT